jgi:hypothetical protein
MQNDTIHIIIDIDKNPEIMIELPLENNLKQFIKNIKLERSLFEICLHYYYYNLVYFFSFIKYMLCKFYIYDDVYILNHKDEIILKHNSNNKYNVVLYDNGILIYVENNNNIFIKYENILEYTYYKKGCIMFNVLGNIDNSNNRDNYIYSQIKVFLFCHEKIGYTIFTKLKNYINYHIKYNNMNVNTLYYYNHIHRKKKFMDVKNE